MDLSRRSLFRYLGAGATGAAVVTAVEPPKALLEPPGPAAVPAERVDGIRPGYGYSVSMVIPPPADSGHMRCCRGPQILLSESQNMKQQVKKAWTALTLSLLMASALLGQIDHVTVQQGTGSAPGANVWRCQLFDPISNNSFGISGQSLLTSVQTNTASPVLVQVIDNDIGTAGAVYRAVTTGLIPAATPTDVFYITGSASKTVRISRIEISGSAATAVLEPFKAIMRSTANSGGTCSPVTIVPLDSNFGSATATVNSCTANPTLGTLVGLIATGRLFLPTTAGSVGQPPLLWQFGSGPNGIAAVLRGTSQVLAINLNSNTVSNGSLEFMIEWVER